MQTFRNVPRPLASLAGALALGLLVLPQHAQAQSVEVALDNGEIITLDSGVVRTCEAEGMNLGACACVVSIMLEEEGLSSMSLTEMTRLANAYPGAYSDARAHCISIN